MLWQFGLGKTRLVGLSVTATKERHITEMKGAAKKAVATRVRRGCKAPNAASGSQLLVTNIRMH